MELNLREGLHRISAGLGSLLALLGLQAPFEKSSERLANELLLIEVSDNSVRKETQLMGQLQGEVEAVQRERSQMLNVPQAIAQAGGKKPGRLLVMFGNCLYKFDGSQNGFRGPLRHCPTSSIIRTIALVAELVYAVG